MFFNILFATALAAIGVAGLPSALEASDIPAAHLNQARDTTDIIYVCTAPNNIGCCDEFIAGIGGSVPSATGVGCKISQSLNPYRFASTRRLNGS